jgi:hypothetical protein
MLGGSFLSTVDMLNSSDDEMIRKIKESMDLAGLQFEQMGKHEQRYVTRTLGLESTAEAAKFLGGTMASLNAELKQQTFNEDKAKRYSTIVEKLSAIFESMMIGLGPLIEILGELASILGYVLIPIFKALNIVFSFVLNAIISLGSLIKRVFEPLWDSLVEALKPVYTLFSSIIKYIEQNETLMTILGLAVGILVLNSGLLSVVWRVLFGLFRGSIGILKVLGKGLIAIVAKVFGLATSMAVATPAVTGFTMAEMFAVGPTLAFGFAVGMLGLAIAAIFYTLSLFVEQMVNLIKVAADAPGSILELGLGFGLLAGSLLTVGLTAGLAAIGLVVLGLGFLALGIGLAFVKTEDIEALAGVFLGLGNILENFRLGVLGEIIDAMKEFASIADSIDTNSMFQIGYMFQRIGEFVEISGDGGTVENLEKTVASLDIVMKSAAVASSKVQPTVIEKIMQSFKSESSGASADKSVRYKVPPIIVKINEREIIRIVEKYNDGLLA